MYGVAVTAMPAVDRAGVPLDSNSISQGLAVIAVVTRLRPCNACLMDVPADYRTHAHVLLLGERRAGRPAGFTGRVFAWPARASKQGSPQGRMPVVVGRAASAPARLGTHGLLVMCKCNAASVMMPIQVRGPTQVSSGRLNTASLATQSKATHPSSAFIGYMIHDVHSWIQLSQ